MGSGEFLFASLGTILLIVGVILSIASDANLGYWLMGGGVVSYIISAVINKNTRTPL